MNEFILFGFVVVYIMMVTLIYAGYLILAFKFAFPIMVNIFGDDNSDGMGGGLFMCIFWFGGGLVLVGASMKLMPSVVSFVNQPLLTDAFNGRFQ